MTTTMTCKELGGACDLELVGDTADEVIKLQDRHLREVVADLQFGPSSDGYLGAGVYEFDATLANGLTVTQAQGGVSLTLIYE